MKKGLKFGRQVSSGAENKRSVMMPKWLLFGLAAIVDFVIAVIAYRSGRVLIPAVLAVAGICFIIAAVGTAKQAKR